MIIIVFLLYSVNAFSKNKRCLEYLISGKEADIAARIEEVRVSLKKTDEKLRRLKRIT